MLFKDDTLGFLDLVSGMLMRKSGANAFPFWANGLKNTPSYLVRTHS
jgi:hypothetical protein